MSTDTIERTDLEFLVGVAFDSEIACVGKGCENPAKWRWVNRPCSHSFFICDPHKNAEAKRLEEGESAGVLAHCAPCGSILIRYDLTRI